MEENRESDGRIYFKYIYSNTKTQKYLEKLIMYMQKHGTKKLQNIAKRKQHPL